MAGFNTHITTSTLVGIGYGTLGYVTFDIRPETCFVAAGLCSVAGILPDVDSDSGQAVREITGFMAAVIPLLMLDHLQAFGMTHELMVFAGGCFYILIRFGLSAILKRITVHRGMWHSIPAAVIAGLLTSVICSCQELFPRSFKVLAVVIGYTTHLILDEVYSVDLRRVRIKKSFGTALKFFGKSTFANVLIYAQLAAVMYIVSNDPMLTGRETGFGIAKLARNAIGSVFGTSENDSHFGHNHASDESERHETRNVGVEDQRFPDVFSDEATRFDYYDDFEYEGTR